MTDPSIVTDRSIARGEELTLEIDALEERVAPGLLLGAFVGASLSANVGATVNNGWWAPPPPPCHGWWW